MKNYENVKGSIDSIETFGLVDGPGIRYVIFLNGCNLRCKFCHNPEMFLKKEDNTTVEEQLNKIKRYKPYFKNGGGVTFSGGEPLLQIDFIKNLTIALKNEGIHVALDTAGVGLGNYKEIISLVDLVILDIKHLTKEGYFDVTQRVMGEVLNFVKVLNESNADVWIRQVVVPGVHDNEKYMTMLRNYLKDFPHIKKIEFLPYHKMGDEKYKKLNIENPYLTKEAMDIDECQRLFDKYMKDLF